METLSNIAIAAAVVAAFIAVILAAHDLLLSPVRPEKGTDVFAVVRASGSAEGLEQLVHGLIWLRDSGRAELDVVIAGADLTPEARSRAALLAEKCGGVFCTPQEIPFYTEDENWKKKGSQL